MAPPRAQIDVDAFCAHIRSGGTITDFAALIGVHATTINGRIRADAELRRKYQAAQAEAALHRGGKTVTGKDASPTLDIPHGRLRDLKYGEVAKLCEENGLDVEQWTIDKATVNKWGQPGEESRQVKVQMRPRVWSDDLRPAAITAPLNLPKPKAPRRPSKAKPLKIVIHGDDHAPYNDPGLHRAFLRFLGDEQPDVLIHNGDLLDFPTISRHRDDPSHNATPNECVDAGAQLLLDRRGALPDARIVFIRGNHDDRPRTELLARAERMYGMRPAQFNGEPPADHALSLRKLLRLDEMGIELAGDGTDGEYFHDGVRFGETLEVRHGFLTGPKAAAGTVERLGRNVFFGHTHHKRDHFVTRRLYDQEQVLVGVEVGPMCLTGRDGAPYAPTTDWHAGFVVVYLHADGVVEHSHARWIDGSIRWQGRSWRP